jgi:hypothetical protein
VASRTVAPLNTQRYSGRLPRITRSHDQTKANATMAQAKPVGSARTAATHHTASVFM